MATQVVLEVKPLWIQDVLDSYATDVATQTLLQQLVIQSPDALIIAIGVNLEGSTSMDRP